MGRSRVDTGGINFENPGLTPAGLILKFDKVPGLTPAGLKEILSNSITRVDTSGFEGNINQ